MQIKIFLAALTCLSACSNEHSDAIKQTPDSNSVEKRDNQADSSATRSDEPEMRPRPKITGPIGANTECRVDKGEIRFVDGAEPVVVSQNPKPGHSHRGGAFDEGPRLPATLWDGAFDLEFETDGGCSDEAEKYIGQGMGQLHGFLNYEAERSFRTAESIDPACHFAKVGLVLANSIWVQEGKRGADFLRHALASESEASPHSRAYLRALEHLYSAANDRGSVAEFCFTKYLGEVVRDFPDDLDAKALFALEIWDSNAYILVADSEDIVEKKQAVSGIIDEVLAVKPLHPVHHYKIHLWDRLDTAEHALDSADQSGLSSPKVAHMWHMSGHIFSKTGYDFDTAKNQEIAARVDHRYMSDRFVLPYELHNHYHNNEWLSNSLIQLGSYTKGELVAGNLIAVPQHPRKNSPEDVGSHAGYGPQRLAEAWILQHKYRALRNAYGDNLFYLSTLFEEAQKKMHALIAVAYLENGPEAFDGYVKEIKEAGLAFDAKLMTALKNGLWRAAFDRLEEGYGALEIYLGYRALNQDDFETASYIVKNHRTYHLGGWSPAFDLNAALLDAEVTLRDGDASPADLEQKLGTLFGAAGEIDQGSDAGIRIEQLRLKYPDVEPLKMKQRPVDRTADDIVQYGSLTWQPHVAPPLQRTDIEGRRFNLADQKKPTVVIFSLTDGCAFCRLQIAHFYEQYPAFASKYDVVVLTLDQKEVLEEVVEVNEEQFGLSNSDAIRMISLAGELPLPQPFIDYRVYDGFEGAPLHGVFLVDRQGKILFEDISFRAFDDVEYLLNEFARLLNPKLNSYR